MYRSLRFSPWVQQMPLYRPTGYRLRTVFRRRSSSRNGKEKRYPVHKMMSSTSVEVPSLKWMVLPSILVNSGLSVIWGGKENPIGFVFQVQTMLFAPYLTHWRAMSSADKLEPTTRTFLSLKWEAFRKQWECRTPTWEFFYSTRRRDARDREVSSCHNDIVKLSNRKHSVFGKVFHNHWEIVRCVVVGHMTDNMVERNPMTRIIFGLPAWKGENENNKHMQQAPLSYPKTILLAVRLLIFSPHWGSQTKSDI